MEDDLNKADIKDLGKFKQIKYFEKKENSNKIDYFSVEDIYCDIKKIKISKKDLPRKGENGLKVPEKFLNFEKCGITYAKLVNIFINSLEVNFYTSNQHPSEPVSFSCKFYNGILIFVNLHQFVSHDSSKKLKLCEDNSNIKIGNKSYEINEKDLKKFIDYLKNFFTVYLRENTKSNSFYVEKKSFLSKIKNILYKKNDVDDTYLNNYLLNNKKINIQKVYP